MPTAPGRSRVLAATAVLAGLLGPLAGAGADVSAATPLPLAAAGCVQSFDSLPATGTSSAFPPGFGLSESGTNADTTYAAGDGSGNGGNTYSLGPTASTDRALGALSSGALQSRYGVRVSGTITGLSVPPGATIVLRWSDPDETGPDDAIAVDDLALAPDGRRRPPSPARRRSWARRRWPGSTTSRATGRSRPWPARRRPSTASWWASTTSSGRASAPATPSTPSRPTAASSCRRRTPTPIRRPARGSSSGSPVRPARCRRSAPRCS